MNRIANCRRLFCYCADHATSSTSVTSTISSNIPTDLQTYVSEDNALFTKELQQWESEQSVRDQAKSMAGLAHSGGGHPAYGPWMPAHYEQQTAPSTSSAQGLADATPTPQTSPQVGNLPGQELQTTIPEVLGII